MVAKNGSTAAETVARHKRALLSVSEIAEHLSVSPRTVWRLIREGRESSGRRGLFPTYHPGRSGHVRMKLEDVERYVESTRYTLADRRQ